MNITIIRSRPRRLPGRSPGLRTNGEQQIRTFDRLGKKVRPGTFLEDESRLTGVPKSPSVKTHEICSDPTTANLRTNIMDFKGSDSSIILILRGGIPRPKGNLPESLSQASSVGIILVGRLGVSQLCLFY